MRVDCLRCQDAFAAEAVPERCPRCRAADSCVDGDHLNTGLREIALEIYLLSGSARIAVHHTPTVVSK